MITPKKALQIILKDIRPLDTVEILSMESLGYTLAENIFARVNIPPFDNSAMDGFAVRTEDVSSASLNNPLELSILADQPAGYVFKKRINKGECLRIMTGAVIPQGSDAVVRKEDTRVRNNKVMIYARMKKEENIRKTGEDVKKGDKIIAKEIVISPAEIGMLSSLGKDKIKVIRKPKVAIIITGDEIVEAGIPLTEGKIRNSNGPALRSQVLTCGAEPIYLGIVTDNKEKMKIIIKKALAFDIILTSGGVSVGEYDFLQAVLKDMKFKLKFWKVAQRPGEPLLYGTIERKPVFGLPGNPVSAMVCFEEYIRPMLLKCMGRLKLFRPEIEAELKQDLRKKKGREHFLRVFVEKEKGKYIASLTGPQGSGILKSMVLANGIALIPSSQESLKKGSKIKVQLIKMPEDH